MIDEVKAIVERMESPEPELKERKKPVNINIAFAPELAAQLKVDAHKHGLSVTSFLRQLYLMYVQAQNEKNRVEER